MKGKMEGRETVKSGIFYLKTQHYFTEHRNGWVKKKKTKTQTHNQKKTPIKWNNKIIKKNPHKKPHQKTLTKKKKMYIHFQSSNSCRKFTCIVRHIDSQCQQFPMVLSRIRLESRPQHRRKGNRKTTFSRLIFCVVLPGHQGCHRHHHHCHRHHQSHPYHSLPAQSWAD